MLVPPIKERKTYARSIRVRRRAFYHQVNQRHSHNKIAATLLPPPFRFDYPIIYAIRLAETLPPFDANSFITAFDSQMFISAEPSVAPE